MKYRLNRTSVGLKPASLKETLWGEGTGLNRTSVGLKLFWWFFRLKMRTSASIEPAWD